MGITIPTVNKACVFLDLKTGVIIWGVFHLVRQFILSWIYKLIIQIVSIVVAITLDHAWNLIDFIIFVIYIINDSLLIHGSKTVRFFNMMIQAQLFLFLIGSCWFFNTLDCPNRWPYGTSNPPNEPLVGPYVVSAFRRVFHSTTFEIMDLSFCRAVWFGD